MSAYNSDTYKRLKGAGYTFDSVERYNHYTKRRADFCQFADVIAFHPDLPGALAVQTTTAKGNQIMEHVRKVESPIIRQSLINWLLAGNRFEIWAWSLKSQRSEDGSFLVGKTTGRRLPKIMQSSDRIYDLEIHDLGYDLKCLEEPTSLHAPPEYIWCQFWTRLRDRNIFVDNAAIDHIIATCFQYTKTKRKVASQLGGSRFGIWIPTDKEDTRGVHTRRKAVRSRTKPARARSRTTS